MNKYDNNDLKLFFSFRDELKDSVYFNRIIGFDKKSISAVFEIPCNTEIKKHFVFRKNTIPFNLFFPVDNIYFAIEIIKEFKKYFSPLWHELGEGKYESARLRKIEKIEYKNIYRKNNLLIVDDYSTDLYIPIIVSCFNDIFKNGTSNDMRKLMSIIEKMAAIAV